MVLHDIKQSMHSQQFMKRYNTTGHTLTSSDTGRCLTTKTKPKFYICPYETSEDIYISRSLSIDGIWEPKMTKLLQELLRSQKNITFIDIGANIGYFSLLAAAQGHNVIAIEPITKNLQQFSKAIVLNRVERKIRLLQNIVSNLRTNKIELTVARRNQGAARVLSDNELRDKGGVIETAASILMDDLIGLIHTPDAIIKIDVEGHECKVMAKSSHLFKRFNVKTVFMEWQKMSQRKHIHGTSCTPAEITRLSEQLHTWGFTPYDVQHGNKLDSTNSVRWTAGDVIWKRE